MTLLSTVQISRWSCLSRFLRLLRRFSHKHKFLCRIRGRWIPLAISCWKVTNCWRLWFCICRSSIAVHGRAVGKIVDGKVALLVIVGAGRIVVLKDNNIKLFLQHRINHSLLPRRKTQRQTFVRRDLAFWSDPRTKRCFRGFSWEIWGPREARGRRIQCRKPGWRQCGFQQAKKNNLVDL